MAGMELLENRIQTFKIQHTIEDKKIRWRYHKLPADSMAILGFYHCPFINSDDGLIYKNAVNCIYCNRMIKDVSVCRTQKKNSNKESMQNVLQLHLDDIEDTSICFPNRVRLLILNSSIYNKRVDWEGQSLIKDPFNDDITNFARSTFTNVSWPNEQDPTNIPLLEEIVKAGLLKYDISLSGFTKLRKKRVIDINDCYCIYCKFYIAELDKDDDLLSKHYEYSMKNDSCFFINHLSSFKSTNKRSLVIGSSPFVSPTRMKKMKKLKTTSTKLDIDGDSSNGTASSINEGSKIVVNFKDHIKKRGAVNNQTLKPFKLTQDDSEDISIERSEINLQMNSTLRSIESDNDSINPVTIKVYNKQDIRKKEKKRSDTTKEANTVLKDIDSLDIVNNNSVSLLGSPKGFSFNQSNELLHNNDKEQTDTRNEVNNKLIQKKTSSSSSRNSRILHEDNFNSEIKTYGQTGSTIIPRNIKNSIEISSDEFESTDEEKSSISNKETRTTSNLKSKTIKGSSFLNTANVSRIVEPLPIVGFDENEIGFEAGTPRNSISPRPITIDENINDHQKSIEFKNEKTNDPSLITEQTISKTNDILKKDTPLTEQISEILDENKMIPPSGQQTNNKTSIERKEKSLEHLKTIEKFDLIEPIEGLLEKDAGSSELTNLSKQHSQADENKESETTSKTYLPDTNEMNFVNMADDEKETETNDNISSIEPSQSNVLDIQIDSDGQTQSEELRKSNFEVNISNPISINSSIQKQEPKSRKLALTFVAMPNNNIYAGDTNIKDIRDHSYEPRDSKYWKDLQKYIENVRVSLENNEINEQLIDFIRTIPEKDFDTNVGDMIYKLVEEAKQIAKKENELRIQRLNDEYSQLKLMIEQLNPNDERLGKLMTILRE